MKAITLTISFLITLCSVAQNIEFSKDDFPDDLAGLKAAKKKMMRYALLLFWLIIMGAILADTSENSSNIKKIVTVRVRN